MRASGIGDLLSNHKCCDTARQFSGAITGSVAISGCQLPAFLCSAVIPPGVCRHFGHDDISRRMEFGTKDAFEQSHGFLDEARLLLGRIGTGGDRGIDMNRVAVMKPRRENGATFVSPMTSDVSMGSALMMDFLWRV